MRFVLALLFSAFAFPAFAREPTATVWSYPQFRTPPAPNPVPTTPSPVPPQPTAPPSEYVFPAPGPIDDGLPVRATRGREVQPGQQHWVSGNLGVFQPTTFRLGVKVWPRPNGSLWVEGFWGSALFNIMYGFGVRAQFTAFTLAGGDRIMIAPGAGMHILPNWEYDNGYSYAYGYYDSWRSRNTLYWVYCDVDISWLHDFSPHFGFELGCKIGVAGLVSGRVGRRDHYPDFLMWGKGAYPIFSVYSGFRF